MSIANVFSSQITYCVLWQMKTAADITVLYDIQQDAKKDLSE